MPEQAITGKLLELKKELIKLNMQRATGTTLANPGRPRLVRRTIAQLYTLLHQKRVMKATAPAQQPKGGKEQHA